jgi:hypothetical protein
VEQYSTVQTKSRILKLRSTSDNFGLGLLRVFSSFVKIVSPAFRMEVDSIAHDHPRMPSSSAEQASRMDDDAPQSTLVMDSVESADTGAPVSGVDASEETAFKPRDHEAMLEEESGVLQFRVVRNDGLRHNMIWLMQAKNLFSTQLPKMPREYITRLVFDRKHRSLLALKNGRVVGGICFRPFVPQRFAEVAFLAVTSSEQIKVWHHATCLYSMPSLAAA